VLAGTHCDGAPLLSRSQALTTISGPKQRRYRMFLTHIGRGRASTYDFATVPSPNTCSQSHFIAHGGLISLQAGHSFAVSVTLGPPFHPAQVARLRLVNISPSPRRSPREWPSAPKSKVGGEAGSGSYLVDTLVTEGNEKPAPLGSTRPFHQLVLNSHVGVICGQLFGTYTRGIPSTLLSTMSSTGEWGSRTTYSRESIR